MAAPEKEEDVNKHKTSNTKEPLIGSSKRKRKSTIIKRNVVVDEKSGADTNEVNEESTSKVKSIKLVIPSKDKGEKPKTDSRKSKRIANNKKNQVQIKEEPGVVNSEEENTKNEDLKQKNRYFCEFCREFDMIVGLTSKEKLEKHLNKYHFHETVCNDTALQKLVFECNHCEEPIKFPTKQRLMYHVNSRHPGIIEFICEVCTCTFKLKANYKAHMATHNLVVKKKFQCCICGGTFVNRAGFESHKRRFPGPHFKKSCQHCGFSFSRESHMKNHRCKKLLLEEAEKARLLSLQPVTPKPEMVVDVPIPDTMQIPTIVPEEKETTCEVVIEPQDGEQVYYSSMPGIEESVVLREYQEGDGKSEIIDSDQTIIIRDITGSNKNSQIYQAVAVNDIENIEDTQLHVLQWSVVGPYIVEKKPKFQ